jgi:hypothetical protein
MIVDAGVDELILRCVTPAIWVAAIVSYSRLWRQLPARSKDWNFDLYYVSGLASLKGIDPTRTDIAPIGRSLGCHFPQRLFANGTPLFQLIFTGLAHFDLLTAFWLWTAVSAISLVATVLILLKMTRLGTTRGALLSAIFLLYPPTIQCFWYAEAELIVLFLLTCTLWCVTHDWDVTAGIALGLAASLKAYPGLIGGYLVATRRYRALASAGGTGVLGILLAVGILGVSVLTGFLLRTHETFSWNFSNLSLSAFLTRDYWRLFTTYSPQFPRRVMVLGAQVCLAGLTYSVTAKPNADERMSYGLWVVTALMDSPIVWLAYLVLLAIPTMSLVRARPSASGTALSFAIASIALAFVMAPLENRFLASRLWHVLSEGEFLALGFAYISGYLFLRGAHHVEEVQGAQIPVALS